MQSSRSTHFLTLGTRGSPLALVQAKNVQQLLAKLHQVDEADIAIAIINTDGDRTQSENLSLKNLGGKGLFSKEIETALLEGKIDVGVHSAKDMATTLPDGLDMPVFLQREDVRDAFISLIANSIDDLPDGAKLGTSSLRRAAQMRQARPDLRIVEFRGNVDTRLQKLKDGIADATLLAMAGLNRLGKSTHVTQIMDPMEFPPAPAQGAVGLQIRHNDDKTRAAIAPLNHLPTHQMVTAERALLALLDGSCRTPIGAYSTLSNGTLTLRGQVLSPDGQLCFTQSLSGSATQAEELGKELGTKLVVDAGAEFVADLNK